MTLPESTVDTLARVSVCMQADVRWNYNVTGVELAAYLLESFNRNTTIAGRSVVSIVEKGTACGTTDNPRNITQFLSQFEMMPSDRKHTLLVPWVFITVVSTICVSLRLCSKRLLNNGLKTNDWWIVAGWILATITTLGLLYNVVSNNWQAHGWNQTINQIRLGTITIYVTTYTDTGATACVRMSLLLLYRGMIGTKHFWRATKGIMVATWVCFSLMVAYHIVACRPWEQWNSPENFFGPLGVTLPLIRTLMSVNIALDLAILLLPVPAIYKLDLPLRDKFTVVLLIALGGVACVTSVMRFFAWPASLEGYDLSWRTQGTSTWSLLEPHIGIICASFPAIRKLVMSISDRSYVVSEVAENENADRGILGSGASEPLSFYESASRQSSGHDAC